MHFHLPKPLHGWREFTGEVGIIVIGVLIALGAEQLVDSWHWHEKVGVVRQSIMGELANDRGRWQENMQSSRCALRYLDQLDRWAQQGGTAPPPPAATRFVQQNQFLWMHSANWNLATSSQTLDHFPLDEQLDFAALYDGIAHRQVDIEVASDIMERLPSLQALADNDEGRPAFRAALGALRSKIGSLTDNDGYMTRHFDAVGAKATRSDFAADKDDPNQCRG
jgi:hypothetical protein